MIQPKIVIHGGAGPDSEFIRKNIKGYEEGLKEALNTGYEILEKGGTAVNAVEAAIRSMEDNPLFNCGKGSALNEYAEVEMDASIMNGKDLKSGAVTLVRNIKNPITAAKTIMEHSKFIYLGNSGAKEIAKEYELQTESEDYFITEYQLSEYAKELKKMHDDSDLKENGKEKSDNRIEVSKMKKQGMHGTVGAVALDSFGNIAAGTSTGGLPCCKKGRIADSSMIGTGTFADNNTCAVSTTGDGEVLMKAVIAHSVSSLIKYKGLSLQDACKEVIHKENSPKEGDIGLVAVDREGNISLEFNCERMHRGWKSGREEFNVSIYRQ